MINHQKDVDVISSDSLNNCIIRKHLIEHPILPLLQSIYDIFIYIILKFLGPVIVIIKKNCYVITILVSPHSKPAHVLFLFRWSI